MTMKKTFILLFLINFLSFTWSSPVNNCPCQTQDLCKTLNGTGKEVYAFVVATNKTVWSQFDWSRLTTVAIAGEWFDTELYCFAHQNNVRVVKLVDIPVAKLEDNAYVKQWIKDTLNYAQQNFLDGVNIDIEEPIAANSSLVAALSDFTKQVAEQFHQAIPGSQVSFDVPWSAWNAIGGGIDGRNYDYVALANAVDFLFLMSYDEMSQWFGDECLARPNSGLYDTSGGVLSYLQLGIPPSKLVMGLPWYGYSYDCIKTAHPSDKCYIKRVEFRGNNCSDIVGQQIPYSDIVSSKYYYWYYWDEHSSTPYLYYQDTETNKTKQLWFDDYQSLPLKVSFAQYENLRGVGMWNANQLDYSGSASGKAQVKSMWETLPKYK